MIVKTYSDLTITVLAETPNPASIVYQGLQTCMKKDPSQGRLSLKQAEYLLKAGHTSPLEHVSQTIYVTGISRSLLAQITRHRTFKFTSSSQHYQDYSNYEMVVAPELCGNGVDTPTRPQRLALEALKRSLDAYTEALSSGLPKEECRQLLPGASAVNLMITADARNMVNFFNQRRCERNVEEMINFADTWWRIARLWFPEVFTFVGAPCVMTGRCTQGSMRSPKCAESFK